MLSDSPELSTPSDWEAQLAALLAKAFRWCGKDRQLTKRKGWST